MLSTTYEPNDDVNRCHKGVVSGYCQDILDLLYARMSKKVDYNRQTSEATLHDLLTKFPAFLEDRYFRAMYDILEERRTHRNMLKNKASDEVIKKVYFPPTKRTVFTGVLEILRNGYEELVSLEATQTSAITVLQTHIGYKRRISDLEEEVNVERRRRIGAEEKLKLMEASLLIHCASVTTQL